VLNEPKIIEELEKFDIVFPRGLIMILSVIVAQRIKNWGVWKIGSKHIRDSSVDFFEIFILLTIFLWIRS
jgi:hypothetical protein